MTVKVRLFAALRELAGASHVEASGRTAGDVADALSVAYGERFAAIAAVSSFVINGERAERGTPVADGDEVAILPPVSGGAGSRTLWLLRHAKSSWDRPGLDDRERPLAPRGVRAAALMGAFIETEGIRPDLVVCSSALRTRQTLAAILPTLGPELEVSIEPKVYTFDAEELLQRIRSIPADIGSAMLVGHNPACQELALMVSAAGARREELERKFPTGAMVEIDLPLATWTDVGVGTGEILRFVTPRELEARE